LWSLTKILFFYDMPLLIGLFILACALAAIMVAIGGVSLARTLHSSPIMQPTSPLLPYSAFFSDRARAKFHTQEHVPGHEPKQDVLGCQ